MCVLMHDLCTLRNFKYMHALQTTQPDLCVASIAYKYGDILKIRK